VRNFNSIIIAAVAITAIAGVGAASAADLPLKAPPKAQEAIYNWTGFYIGAQVGGAWSNYRFDNVNLTAESSGQNASSVTGGGHLGYNWQYNTVVFGVEAEFSGTNLRGSTVSVVNPVVTYNDKVDWYGTVVGRLGVALNRTLLYATGGVAFADIRTSGLNGPNGTIDSFSNTANRVGWAAGVGAEYQITPNCIAGLDYKHLQFDKYNSSGITNTLVLAYTLTGIRDQIDQVTARISYKFGGPVTAKY
jgi:outer membrane immunogenic protein